MIQWFYVEEGQQAGPVDENTFLQLVASGKITPETLVWHDGMPDWRTYAEVTLPPGPAAPPPYARQPPAPAPAPISAPAPLEPLPPAEAPSSLALTGMILGLASIPAFCCCFGPLVSLPGAIISAIALSQADANPKSRTYAKIGLVVSLITLLIGFLLLFLHVPIRGIRRWP